MQEPEKNYGIEKILIDFYQTMEALKSDPECKGKQAAKLAMTANDIKELTGYTK
ncbi:MAG: hypothetical protein V4538_02420 [Bacteroidota bacterium]